MTRTRRPASPAAALRVLATGCLLLAGLVCLATGWGDVPLWAPLLLAGVVVVAELRVLQLRLGLRRWPCSLGQAALGAALVVEPGAWCVPAMGLAVAVTARARHAPRLKRDVDVGRCVLAAALASAAAGFAGGGVPGAVLGMAVLWAVDCLVGAVAISRTSSRPLRSLLASGAPVSAVHTAGNASLGLLAAFLAREAPVALLGLVVPVGLLWSSYDQGSRRSEEARLFAELARGREHGTARSPDESADLVVTVAARLLGGADVDLLVLTDDGPVLHRGDERGTPERRSVSRAVLDEPWVLAALGERAVHAGRVQDRPCLSAVLTTRDRPRAVLRVRRGPAAPAFDRKDLRLVEVLVGQAEAWLSAPDDDARPGQPLPPAADDRERSALAVVREAADHLARAAERGCDVDAVVDELHLVERAVAGLLGDLAPAPRGSAARPPVGTGAEWTTTGVLG